MEQIVKVWRKLNYKSVVWNKVSSLGHRHRRKPLLIKLIFHCILSMTVDHIVIQRLNMTLTWYDAIIKLTGIMP